MVRGSPAWNSRDTAWLDPKRLDDKRRTRQRIPKTVAIDREEAGTEDDGHDIAPARDTSSLSQSAWSSAWSSPTARVMALKRPA